KFPIRKEKIPFLIRNSFFAMSAAQRFALPAGGRENQLTKQKNAFVQNPFKIARVLPDPLHIVLGGSLRIVSALLTLLLLNYLPLSLKLG
ncbi:MAG TPA: hypothetical protein VFC02_11210, partial [Anaerolineales bacterium]|nr:hypothetical protein [Anaerolineales bacterium]